MNNDPATIAAALRTFAIYAVCAVLAIIIGVLMTNPMTYSSLGFIGFLCAVLVLPILLRWHHPIMIFCWGAPMMMFFLKGDPKFTLVMITLSLAISITERTLNQPRFINVPAVSWSLFFMIGVIALTAKLNGGIGLKAFGSEVYGGKKYVFLIVNILGYFALTAQPIPPGKAQRYVSYFFLGSTLGFIGDLYPFAPGFTHPIFWVIPPMMNYDAGAVQVGTTRLIGTSWAAVSVINALIARYGIRGIFLEGKLWRPAVFFISVVLIFFGGFRSALVLAGLTFTLQFFLEGMHRTKAMPFFVLAVVAGMALAIPLGGKLPFTFQRTLAFLPEGLIHLSHDARLAAQTSSDWRYDMWKALLPQIPEHLLLGKGYAISMEDFASMGADSAMHSADPGQQALALSGDYHNGPLSVILPFGIWGVIAFLWFIIAGMWVVYKNFRYGDPALQLANTFLFTSYVITTFDFFFIFGSFSDGMGAFTGFVGLSVCLNRGVARAPVTPARNIPFSIRLRGGRLKPQPAFQPKTADAPQV